LLEDAMLDEDDNESESENEGIRERLKKFENETLDENAENAKPLNLKAPYKRFKEIGQL
jgi:hypothetical protein